MVYGVKTSQKATERGFAERFGKTDKNGRTTTNIETYLVLHTLSGMVYGVRTSQKATERGFAERFGKAE